METGLVSRLGLATVAAVALYAPTLGLPLPDHCTWTTSVAGAAPTPSPSCGGDLRECLRHWADLRQTPLGGRYVTAHDVALCMEIFNNCIHGGASGGGSPSPPDSRSPEGGQPGTSTPTPTKSGSQGGGNPNPYPPTSTSSGGDESRRGLPTHFAIKFEGISSDCQVAGTNVTCALAMDKLAEGIDSWSARVTGTLSGLTMTGTQKTRNTGHDPCSWESEHIGPVTYAFTAEGTVTAHEGQSQWTLTSSCSGSSSGTTPSDDFTGKWTAVE